MDLIDGSPKEWAFYRVLPNCTEFRGSRGVFGMNFFFWGGRLCGSVLWLVALRRRIWVALVCGTDRGGVSAKRATEFYRVSRTHHVDGKWLAGNVPGRRQFKGSSHERWWLRRRGSRGRVPSFFFFYRVSRTVSSWEGRKKESMRPAGRLNEDWQRSGRCATVF